MDLEVRLEALEAEVKVLKGEIQHILLEIQEQVLLHYYPSLRVQDEEPSDTVIHALEDVLKRRQDVESAAAAAAAEVQSTGNAATADTMDGYQGNGAHSLSGLDALSLGQLGGWPQQRRPGFVSISGLSKRSQGPSGLSATATPIR